MEELFEKFYKKIDSVSVDFKRSLHTRIKWKARLIGIKGARGVGKTTLLLQYIKANLPLDQRTLYISLDNIWFSENKLSDLTDAFVKQGGNYLFLDEVHKYPNWTQELKNIYDDYPELQVVFTGSSLLEILNSRADLSRRAVVYTLQGLSYREYLNLTQKRQLPEYTLDDLLNGHLSIAREINSVVKPLQFFNEYLRFGYFPFFREVPELYYHRLEEVINMTLEIELPLLRKVEVSYVPKLKQLLQIISESVPFIPNVSKLSERIGVNRTTFTSYLYFLQEANLTRNLYKNASGISLLQKPEKIYLENSNFQYALSPNHANAGSVRETFFANQLGYEHQVDFTDQGDFLIDRTYTLEIGGKTKSSKQISDVPNAFIAADNLEYGYGNKIPLWMFGLLY
ncbi:ATP-binding protein [Algoriphagus sp.]|uniref:ATP-binding protein n=1 Tax=Algoriphagus sp. TaxID=1872435 RepID=UPI003F70AA05